MRSSAEFSIDFSTEELLQESSPAQGSIDETSAATQPGPKTRTMPQMSTASPTASDDDSIEIELTAEQIDALLSAKL